jgi:hypothetical protein
MGGQIDEPLLYQLSVGKAGRGGLLWARHTRVYVEWSSLVTAGAVTVRQASRNPASGGALTDDIITLAFAAGLAGKASDVRIDGPLGYIEAEITAPIVGGTVNVYVLANG